MVNPTRVLLILTFLIAFEVQRTVTRQVKVNNCSLYAEIAINFVILISLLVLDFFLLEAIDYTKNS